MSQPENDDLDLSESLEEGESMKLILSESLSTETGPPANKRALSPPSDAEDASKKKVKLENEEEGSSRRESVSVIKVVQKNVDTSVIDLISDKEESLLMNNESREGEIKDFSLDLFKEEEMEEKPQEKSIEETSSSSSIVTPGPVPPGQTTSSIEFNEKDALSSTPHVQAKVTEEASSSEKETAELPKEHVFFIQLSDISILRGIRNRGLDFGPVFKAPHVPDPELLRERLGWEKVEFIPKEPLNKGRVSDASSLSTISSKVSSLGYAADGSSGLSETGKRDRASILPEAPITQHKVIAKLPEFKTTPKHILEDLGHPSSKRKVLRKKKPTEEEGEESDETPLEDKEEEGCLIRPGQDVFAKWGSLRAHFYLGTVLEKVPSQEGKWKIEFNDGLQKVLREIDFISRDALIPGTCVSVVVEDGRSRNAIILSHPIPSGDEGLSYSVEYEAGPKTLIGESFLVPISKIHLTEEQVLAVNAEKRGGAPKEETPSLTGGDLSLNNIVSTKRVRNSRLLITPSKIVKCGGKFVDTSAAETSCSETPKTIASSRKKVIKSKTVFSTTETENDECSSSSARKKGLKRNKKKSGPLFSNMYFIMTKTLKKGPVSGIDAETSDPEDSSSSSSDENEKKEEQAVMNNFSKSQVKSLILKHGGTVLSPFPGEKNKFPSKGTSFYVLSDQGCRTLNFLYGIIHGVTRISYQWVLDSAREGKRFPLSNYLLPVGYSEILGTEIEQGSLESKPLTSLLQKVKILVTGESREDWKGILVRLGAKVLLVEAGHALNSLGEDVDVVFSTDDDKEVLAATSSLPVVSPKWIIQSLINGKKLGFDCFLIK